MPNISHLLHPIEDAVHKPLIPKLKGRPPTSPDEYKLLALPTRLGGLSIPNVTETANSDYSASLQVSTSLVNLLANASDLSSYEILCEQYTAKKKF